MGQQRTLWDNRGLDGTLQDFDGTFQDLLEH